MLTWQTQYSILMRYRQGGRQWAGQTGRSRATAARRTGAPISSAMRERACRTIAARRGSRAEKVRLREAKALADMVGGRCGWEEEDEPPQRFIERLERAVRGFS